MIAGKWTVTLIVIVTGLFYWTLDSFVDSVIFGDGTFITSLFFASAHEIYVRLTTAVVVMLAVYLGCILSGRRKIEKKLSSTAENLRALIRTAPLAIIVVDPDGKVTLWNPAAEKIFGWEEKEVLGLPNPIVPADKQAEFLMFLKRTEVGRLVTREEVSRQRKDGSLLNAILSTAPMRDSSGKFIGTMAMIADVTDRKKAEEALLESKELHRTILRTAMDGFWLVDMNGRVLEVNEAYCRMSGYSEQELLTMSIPDLECVETPSDIAARIEKILKQGEDRFEGRHRRKDGSSFPVEVSAQYKPTRGGHMFAFMRDITERKKAEKELVETSQTLQSLIHASPLAITVLDPNGIVKMWNPAAERIFGWSEQEVVGRFYPVVSDENKDEFRVLRERVFQGESFTGVEVVRRRKDGSSVDISLSTAPLLDFKGDVVGAMGIIDDITERKKMEGQIRRSLAEKEILLKEIHHRVKNNLQVISSILNLQSGYVKDDYDRTLFMESRSRVKSMALIHEKLYRSRDLAKINIADYIRSLTEELMRSYGINAAAVRLNLDIEDVLLDIDTAVPLGLIVNELISNSLKYAFSPGREGEIGIALSSDTEGMLTLTVHDNGTGLPEALDFPKVESLGLQLVTLLTKQIGGTVELKRGEGTTFSIVFKAMGKT